MSGTLMRTALRGAQTQIRHVRPVRHGAARGLVADVYAQVERDFGMLAPPVTLHSPAPATLAACWLMLRETLLASGLASRAAKEAVAIAVSAGNTCPYCVEVHGATLGGLAHGSEAAAIAAGHLDSVADPALRDVAAWAKASGSQELAAGQPVPFPAAHGPELAGVAVTFHYLNRMVNLFLGDGPLPASVPAAARGPAMRVLSRFMGRSASKPVQPGAALDLLPGEPLPRDLAWAAASPAVAGAFARAAAAVEAAGRRSAPAAVRELVLGQLAQWHGHPVGPGRGWADAAVSQLRAAERPAGLLALLTAMSSHQVGQSDIDGFRRHQAGDDALIELTSWASLAAARRVGSWLPTGVPEPTRPASGG